MYRSIVRRDKNLREFTKAVSKLGCSPALRQDVDDFGNLLGHSGLLGQIPSVLKFTS